MTGEMIEQYVYPIIGFKKFTDGDTYRVLIERDIGFYDTIRKVIELRLDYSDTPEKSGPTPFERAEAKRARVEAQLWLTTRPLTVRTRKPGIDTPPVGDGGFGRWLGEIWDTNTEARLADHLRALGLSSVWPTRWRKEFNPNGA